MGSDQRYAMPRLLFAMAPGGPIYSKPGPIYYFEDPRVQYEVRLRLG